MASIRRTLSPAFQEQPYAYGFVGGSPFSSSSPSQKLPSGSKYSPPFPLAIMAVRRFFAGALFHRLNRKGRWRRAFYRCLLFFFLGFLLGLLPLADIKVDDEIRGGRSGFNFDVTKPSHVNVQLDNDSLDRVVKQQRRIDVVLDVRLGVAQRRADLVPCKQLIIITPTYNRALQAYFLNRLGQLLRLVPAPLTWIVVETSAASFETAEILRKSGVMYRHLVCRNNSTSAKDRGVYQRNTALEHIERHRLDGVVYFADDDNVYSLELFDRLRDISRFGTWPVAMLAQSKNKAILEGPVCNGSQVIGWHTNERSKRLRRFHVDMSGFAFNSTILWDPKRWHRPTSTPIRQLDSVKEGFQETSFIEQVVEDESQMEATPAGCSKVMNWHLHLQAHSLVYPKDRQLQKNPLYDDTTR